MKKATDAMVSVFDLDQAVDEKCRGYSEATMARLFRTEPYLAVYIESLATHFSNAGDLDAFSNALDRLIVIIRAIEIGQYRLWRGSIDPSSPLGRMITGDQQQDQQGAK